MPGATELTRWLCTLQGDGVTGLAGRAVRSRRDELTSGVSQQDETWLSTCSRGKGWDLLS